MRLKEKIFMAVITLMLVFCVGIAFAEESTPVAWPGLNAQGDMLYLPKSESFAIGVGTSVASIYDGVLEVRAEMVSPVNEEEMSMMVGAGVGLNIPKVVEKLGGEWILKGITSSIGVLALVDMRDKGTIQPAIYLTILKVQF